MKVIAYNLNGRTEVCIPSIGARMCSGIEGEVFDPPIRFDRVRAALAKDQTFDEAIALLKPVWAETDDEFAERIAAKDVPAGAADIVFLAPSALPDRTYRGAWACNGKAVEIDMPKARDVVRNHLRSVRKPALETLDAEYIRADELVDPKKAKAAIVAKKQALRDAPADLTIDAAKTPAELTDCLTAICARLGL